MRRTEPTPSQDAPTAASNCVLPTLTPELRWRALCAENLPLPADGLARELCVRILGRAARDSISTLPAAMVLMEYYGLTEAEKFKTPDAKQDAAWHQNIAAAYGYAAQLSELVLNRIELASKPRTFGIYACQTIALLVWAHEGEKAKELAVQLLTKPGIQSIERRHYEELMLVANSESGGRFDGTPS